MPRTKLPRRPRPKPATAETSTPDPAPTSFTLTFQMARFENGQRFRVDGSQLPPERLFITIRDVPLIFNAARAQEAADRAICEKARQAVLDSPQHQKAAKIEAQLAEAKQRLEEAERVREESLSAARQALADGKDPQPHEDRARKAAEDQHVFGQRIAPLESFIGEARREAAKVESDAEDAKWDELKAEAEAEEERLSREFGVMLSRYLVPLWVARARIGGDGLEVT